MSHPFPSPPLTLERDQGPACTYALPRGHPVRAFCFPVPPPPCRTSWARLLGGTEGVLPGHPDSACGPPSGRGTGCLEGRPSWHPLQQPDPRREGRAAGQRRGAACSSLQGRRPAHDSQAAPVDRQAGVLCPVWSGSRAENPGAPLPTEGYVLIRYPCRETGPQSGFIMSGWISYFCLFWIDVLYV